MTGNGSFGIRSAVIGLYSTAPLKRFFLGANKPPLAVIAVLSIYRVDFFHNY